MNQLLMQNELELLECFFPHLKDLASKEIEKKSGFSHETTFRILKGLVNKKCLIEKKVGKTNVYEFVNDRDLKYQVFIYHMNKKRLDFRQKHALRYKRLYECLNDVNPEGPAILFGSYAKGTQTAESDIDLLLVTNKKNVRSALQVYKTKYAMNIQPVLVRTSDFMNMKKDNPQFWNDILTYGVILDGVDRFFKEVYIND
ncbi:MAG: nucleotidyltransferase domain-containing protein [archaeon]